MRIEPMTTDAQTLKMLLGGKKTKAPRKPRSKSARVGASVQLFTNGETYTITSRDEKYKNAFYLDGLEFSVSRDMFKVL
jgi:hypothetical protein